MMTTNDIRKKFLAYFEKKGHTIIDSDSLVPKDDPTVLFTTAGMQQFKRQFLGYTDGFTRAATSQKCLRTDDLDKVGKTPVHHTFFEMLGNFSFGDYFKPEAISWAWEFFTEVLKLPADKLWASVYKDDDEAEKIWKKLGKGFNPKHLIKLGDHDNFWPADAKEKGPNGPCGPCSEIFFDFGVNKDCKNKKCDPTCPCGRFAEIWNLVFTQYNRKEGGVLEPLPNKNIDTGMGLERLAAVMQGKKTNFEIDIFAHIIKSAKKLIPDIAEIDARIVSDHIRGVVLGINDGVMPSNEGRGYVIKKLINDITDIALRSGSGKPVIYKLVSSVVEVMKQPYPELGKKQNEIEEIVQTIEKAYFKVRQERLPEFEKKAKETKTEDQLGELLFLYRDTYGLGDNTLINSSATQLPHFKKALVKSQNLMQQQKERSRAGSKMTGDVFADALIDLGVPKTKFLGYNQAHATSTILKILADSTQIEEAGQGDAIQIILDKTPFYAESGGQVGDTGFISNGKNKIRITDTQKFEDIYIHSGVIESGSLKVTDQVDAQIDIERRQSIMRNHTATHLLQAALREVLGAHVKQQGSLVAEDRLRFDFAHPKAISAKEIEQIELDVNTMILANDELIKEFLDIDAAKNSGALAFFAEKYGKVVRVVSIGSRSKEFCGGTHVDATGEIGLFKFISESSVAQGIRRIEAKTGLGALNYVNQIINEAKNVSVALNAPILELSSKVNELSKQNKAARQVNANIAFEKFKEKQDEIIKGAKSVGETKIISYFCTDLEIDMMRRVSDLFRQKTKSYAIILGSISGDNAFLLVSISDDLIKRGIDANEIVREVAPMINGSGGGRPQMAQAGSKDTTNLEKTIKETVRLIEKKVST